MSELFSGSMSYKLMMTIIGLSFMCAFLVTFCLLIRGLIIERRRDKRLREFYGCEPTFGEDETREMRVDE